MPFYYAAVMSTRYFQSVHIDELREALTEESTPHDRAARRKPLLDRG